MPSPEAPALTDPAAAAEAARYALLRRLAPSMRHHLVVNLQPIGMIYEVMDRRLAAPEPNLASVRESAQKINGFARAALQSSVDVVSWLSPDESTVSLDEAARECAGLVASSLSFRGYTLHNEVGSLAGEVRRSAIRHLLAASVIFATDEMPPPSQLVLRADAGEGGARITLDLLPDEGGRGFAAEAGYRKLAWSDVQAIAVVEGAQVSVEPGRRIDLLLPWGRPPRSS